MIKKLDERLLHSIRISYTLRQLMNIVRRNVVKIRYFFAE